MGHKTPRLPTIDCPHCGSRARVRTSEALTTLCRELRLRCENDACGHQFVAQIEIVRTVAPSMTPNPEVRLPLANQNLRHQRAKPANDDVPIPTPANDAGPHLAPDQLTRSG